MTDFCKSRGMRRAVCAVLCLLLTFALSAQAFAAPWALTAEVRQRTYTVRAYNSSYDNNLYISLYDLSKALKDTEDSFSITYRNTAADGAFYEVTTGAAPSSSGTITPADTGSEGVAELSLNRNRVFVDGRECRYYTYKHSGNDLYMSLVDVQLMLDITAEFVGDNDVRFFPGMSFCPDVNDLNELGFFEPYNTVLLGDATTGQVLFSVNKNRSMPIASISKLMTYLLLREAADAGSVSLTDSVSISAKAAALSRTVDGTVEVTAGSTVPMNELVYAMLLASSNEAALAIAEHVAGSEEAFVELMNAKAEELGFSRTMFYTCNGLPSYPAGALPAKMQNRMSSGELFRLIDTLLEKYPDVTDITSLTYANMPTLNYTTANSNPLVFNMPGVNGLKTGSTNKAGYCLSATLPVQGADGTHELVAIVLGSELAGERGQVAEILLRWGRLQLGA